MEKRQSDVQSKTIVPELDFRLEKVQLETKILGRLSFTRKMHQLVTGKKLLQMLQSF